MFSLFCRASRAPCSSHSPRMLAFRFRFRVKGLRAGVTGYGLRAGVTGHGLRFMARGSRTSCLLVPAVGGFRV
jgi:hypothetical protein